MRLPAPLLRGLSVLAVGGAFVVSHSAFAVSKPKRESITTLSRTLETAELVKLVDNDRRLTGALPLADNCYVETHLERTADGKVISRLMHECD